MIHGTFGLIVFAAALVAIDDGGRDLVERGEARRATRVEVHFAAEGIRPAAVKAEGAVGESGRNGQAGKDYPFRFASELVWVERMGVGGDADGVVRRLQSGQASIDFFRGRGQQLVTRLRPELSLLLAARRGDGVLLASAGGPLRRDELDLVRSPGETMALGELLPKGPVRVGERWPVPRALVLCWSEYEVITSTTMEAWIESLDARRAILRVDGRVKGVAHGSAGTISIAGTATFDRVVGLITALALQRDESRQSGPVESALNVKSTLAVKRQGIAIPEELSDAALSGLPLAIDDQRAQLRLDAPAGLYTLLHDRDWHLYEDNERRVVLKRLDSNGRTIAQCNLVVGPPAGRGRHQDLQQFQADVQKALGEQFGRIVGSGEVGDAAAPGFRYKLAIEGVEQAQGVVPLWYYYLLASPEGEQVIAIFTLTRGVEAQFGDQDLKLIGSLVWGGKSGGR